MSEKRSIETLIKDQLNIFRSCGIKNQPVTISIPKITYDERGAYPDIEIDSLNAILANVLGYKPNIMNSTVLYSDALATIIITFLFLG